MNLNSDATDGRARRRRRSIIVAGCVAALAVVGIAAAMQDGNNITTKVGPDITAMTTRGAVAGVGATPTTEG